MLRKKVQSDMGDKDGDLDDVRDKDGDGDDDRESERYSRKKYLYVMKFEISFYQRWFSLRSIVSGIYFFVVSM